MSKPRPKISTDTQPVDKKILFLIPTLYYFFIDQIKKQYSVAIKKRARENLGEPWGWQGT